MPTEADYRSAAHELTQISALAAYYAAVLSTWPVEAALGATPVASQAEIAIDDAIAELERARIGSFELAELCHWRAAVCADFRDEVNAWWEANNAGVLGPYPEVPHRWVEI